MKHFIDIQQNSTPMRVAEEGDLYGDAWRIYDFIARNFIGSISPNMQYTSTSVTFAIGNEKFHCKGIREDLVIGFLTDNILY